MKKFLIASLAALTVMLTVAPLMAATAADVQAQIDALMAQIQTLQAQLGTSQGTSSYTFTKDLTVGSKGADVSALQSFLKAQGTTIYPSGLVSGYFGALTKAALVKYQKSVGISPASGYFGPKTRAHINALVASATPTPTPTGSATPTPTPTGSATPTPVSGTLTVSTTGPLASDVPQGASYVDMLDVVFTNTASSSVTITGIKALRGGLSSDTDIQNIHLFDGATRLQTVTYFGADHHATFSGLNVVVPANGSKTLSVKVDLTTGIAVGKTVNMTVAANDVTTSPVITITNTVTGNNMRAATVTNPSLATIRLQSIASGTQVNAGTTGYLAGAFQLQVNNSATNISQITLTEVGSIANTDLANLKLMDGSTQVGPTVAALDANSKANFVFATPWTLASGATKTINVYADVMGTPNRVFILSIQNSYDITTLDTTYNVGITPTILAGGNGNQGNNFPVYVGGNNPAPGVQPQVAVLAGSLTETTATTSPTGNVGNGITNVVLAQFSMKANGEPIKLLQVPFNLTFGAAFVGNGGDVLAGCDQRITNMRLIGDDGSQVGSTITNCTAGTTAAGAAAAYVPGPPGVYTASFGTTAQPVNYVIPANTTRIFSLKADISANLNEAAQTIQANAVAQANGGQGTISLSAVNLVALAGRALSVINVPFSAGLNNSVGTLQVPIGSAASRIGSFQLTAGAGEGLNLQTLTLTMATAAQGPGGVGNIPATFSNVKVNVSGTAFGLVTSSVTAGQQITVAGTNIVAIPVGGSVIVDVYADVATGGTQGNWAPAVQLTTAQATGATSGTSRNPAGIPILGQTFNVAAQGALTATADSSTQASTQYYMGATDVTFGTFKLTTGTIEGVNIIALTLNDVATPVTATTALYNISLWDGSTQVGTTQPSLGPTGNVTFTISGNGYNIPVNTTKTLLIKASASAYNPNALTSNSTHQFRVVNAAAMNVFGALSNVNIVAGGAFPITTNAQTVLRGVMTVALSSSSPSGAHSVSATDQVAIFNFTASGYDSILNKVFMTQTLPATLSATGTPLGLIYRLRDASGYIDGNPGAAVTGGNNLVLSSGATFATTGTTLSINGTAINLAAATSTQVDAFIIAINGQTAVTGVTAASSTGGQLILYRTPAAGTGMISINGTPAVRTGFATTVSYQRDPLIVGGADAATGTGAGYALQLNGVNIATPVAFTIANWVTNINAQTANSGVAATSTGGTGLRLALYRTNAGVINIGEVSTAATDLGLTVGQTVQNAIEFVLPTNYTITAGTGNSRALTIELNTAAPQFFVAGSTVTSFRVTTGNNPYGLSISRGISYNDQGGNTTDINLAASILPITASTLLY